MDRIFWRIRWKMDVTTDPEEVLKSSKEAKNRKASGDDLITVEFIKHGGKMLYEELYRLMVSVWEKERETRYHQPRRTA